MNVVAADGDELGDYRDLFNLDVTLELNGTGRSKKVMVMFSTKNLTFRASSSQQECIIKESHLNYNL